MAIEIPGFSYSLEASGDLSALQYVPVVVDSNGQAAAAGNGVLIAGVLQNKPDAAGKAAQIVQTGITKGIVGTGGVSAGDALETENGVGFITQSTGVTVGIALADGNAGETIPVLLV